MRGSRYADFPAPLLDAGAMHRGRAGWTHLRIATDPDDDPGC